MMAALIEAVQQRWYDLLDNHRYAGIARRQGDPSVQITAGGTVIEVSTIENTVGDVLELSLP